MPLITIDAFTMDVDPNPTSGAGHLDLAFNGPAGARIAVGVWRMNASGPNNMLHAPELTLDANGEVRFPVFGGWPDDLYLVMIEPATTPPTGLGLTDMGAAHPFELLNGEASVPAMADAVIEAAATAQMAFRNHEIRSESYSEQNRLILHALVEGCNLDYPQIFQGGHMRPLTQKLGPASIISVINGILPPGISFAPDALLQEYSQSRPLCLVSFVNVLAPDIGAAVTAVQSHLDRVLGALAEDRGASPIVLAYLAEDGPQNFTLSFPGHIYRGNLVAGFGPGVTGLLDLIETAGQADPWIDFALRLMRSVRIQSNSETQLFQAWSLIEAAAKRAVSSDRTIPVLDDTGQPIRTSRGPLDQAKDLGRVIIYLRDHVGRNLLSGHVLSSTPDFYDQVRLLYDGRNRIAHEGGLQAPGSGSPAASAFDMAYVAKDWASEVLRHEVRRAAGI